MNRQNKIKALDEAFKGNLSSLNKLKEQEVSCLVFVHNDIYRINGIYPKLPKHEIYLDRDLTAFEYNDFLKAMPQSLNKITIHKPSK